MKLIYFYVSFIIRALLFQQCLQTFRIHFQMFVMTRVFAARRAQIRFGRKYEGLMLWGPSAVCIYRLKCVGNHTCLLTHGIRVFWRSFGCLILVKRIVCLYTRKKLRMRIFQKSSSAQGFKCGMLPNPHGIFLQQYIFNRLIVVRFLEFYGHFLSVHTFTIGQWTLGHPLMHA